LETLFLSLVGIKKVRHIVITDITDRIIKILWKLPVMSRINPAILGPITAPIYPTDTTTPPATPECSFGMISTGKLSKVLKRRIFIIPAITIIKNIANIEAYNIHIARKANIKLGTHIRSLFDILIRE